MAKRKAITSVLPRNYPAGIWAAPGTLWLVWREITFFMASFEPGIIQLLTSSVHLLRYFGSTEKHLLKFTLLLASFLTLSCLADVLFSQTTSRRLKDVCTATVTVTRPEQKTAVWLDSLMCFLVNQRKNSYGVEPHIRQVRIRHRISRRERKREKWGESKMWLTIGNRALCLDIEIFTLFGC